MSHHEFITARQFLFNSIVFTLNDNFYKQVTGSPIDRYTSSIFSELVLGDFKKKILSICGNNVILFKLYVDDYFLVIKESHVNNDHQIFKSYHPDLQFTYKFEYNNSIPFLDFYISHTGLNISLD